MIKASKAAYLFKSTDKIKADNPDIPAFEEYWRIMLGSDKKTDNRGVISEF